MEVSSDSEGPAPLDPRDGDQLLRALAALANPHRLRIVAVLVGGRQFVSELAREVDLSRTLVHMHLQRLEAAGLITGSLELSADGRAKKYFQATPFALDLTPETIRFAVQNMTNHSKTTRKK